MNASAERELVHARIVRARGGALPPDGMPSAEILESWTRSMQAGLDYAAPAPLNVVGAEDLRRRRERSAVVRRLAQAELQTLAPQIAGSDYLLAFADQDGVILDLFADNRFQMSGAGILEGSRWSEADCGTNGMGMALACGRSVAVNGLNHYLLRLGDISCTAAPVRDALGEVVGVLDASSYLASRQSHTQALVQMAATHIENGLLLHQMSEHLVLAIHPRPEFLRTLSAGLLAFDGSGRLLAVNARGRQLLQGLDAAPGARFEELFGEPFEQVLARLYRDRDLRLHDTLGSSLVARCVNQPLARHAPPTAPAQAPRSATAAATVVVAAEESMSRDDPAVLAAVRLTEAAVRLKAAILICGETGTGKEMLARHAHRASGRRGAFVAVNCGALPGELFEAELFGYVGGSFTGARREGSAGLIASADGGTLLLDEVRELPLRLQAALLRFLDDGIVRPVGGNATRRVDVQLLAACNADLDAEVQAQRFRADLLYRMNTVRVDLPPLRLRHDFAPAVRNVLKAIDSGRTIDDEAIARLAKYDWPGNFRELRSVLTRALLTSDRQRLGKDDVLRHLPDGDPKLSVESGSALQQAATAAVLREYERAGHSVSQTSRRLGISRTTVYRHLRTVKG